LQGTQGERDSSLQTHCNEREKSSFIFGGIYLLAKNVSRFCAAAARRLACSFVLGFFSFFFSQAYLLVKFGHLAPLVHDCLHRETLFLHRLGISGIHELVSLP
jgi:hypothetical protein